MDNKISEAALSHQHEGRSVIAVNRDKRPYHEGWNKYFTHPQTEQEVEEEFSNGSDGIALILYPSCQLTVLDFDGPHADEAWDKTQIELPETARFRTRSGGKHLYFIMPSGTPDFKRKVRIVKADCSCKKSCGVDLLVHGYALIPPSPGYSEDPDNPLESAVPLPKQIIDIAVSQDQAPPRKTGEGPQNKVSHGERKSTLISLAGSMRSRGMSIEAIRAALETDNEARFDPPVTPREIEDVLKSAEKWGSPTTLEHLTDLGNAKRFENVHGGSALYAAERKKWFLWNGKFWELDRSGQILDYARAIIKSIYAEAGVLDDDKLRKAVAQHAMKSESHSKINAMMTIASSMPSIRAMVDRFDRHPYLINTINCSIDLETGNSRPFDPNDLLTKQIPTVYDPNARCPRFKEFLDQITLGDSELQHFILRAIGCSLTGDTGDRTMFILYGEGANGKSTLVNVIRGILGKDFAREINPKILMMERSDNAADYHLAELHGARFVTASEPGRRKVIKVDLIKQATGGEPMPVRRPYELPFSFTPEFKLWLSTNHKPIIPDTGDAIWERINLIPFLKKFPDDNSRIKNYWDVLLEERSGILNLILEYCIDWQKNGLKPPTTITEQTKKYREEEDIIQSYINDRNIIDPESYVETSPHYADYKDWAEKHGEFVESSTAFGIIMNEKHFPTKLMKIERKVVRCRTGIRIKYSDE